MGMGMGMGMGMQTSNSAKPMASVTARCVTTLLCARSSPHTSDSPFIVTENFVPLTAHGGSSSPPENGQ